MARDGAVMFSVLEAPGAPEGGFIALPPEAIEEVLRAFLRGRFDGEVQRLVIERRMLAVRNVGVRDGP